MSDMTSPPFRTATVTTTLLTGLGFIALAGCGRSSEEAQYQPFHFATTTGEMKAVPRRTLKETPLERSWDLQLPYPVFRSWISPALPQFVFFQVKETYEVMAVDVMSGSPKWVTPPFPKPPKVPPSGSHALASGQGDKAVYDDHAWIVSDDMLYNFDAVYGQIAWRYDLPFAPSTGPLGIGPHGNQRVFFGDWEGRVHAISYDNKRNFAFPLWQMNLRAAVVAPMIEADGLVYAADQEGGVHCFKLDREEVWKFDTKAAIFGGMVTRGRTLFVGNDDNKLYAFDRLNGAPLGTLFVNGPIRKAPFIFQDQPDKLYVFIDHEDPTIGGLACITAQSDVLEVVQLGVTTTKKQREIMRLDTAWRVPNVSHLIGSTPLHLFAIGSDPANRNQVIAINRQLGKVEWTWDCTEGFASKVVGASPRKLAHITQYQDATNQIRSIITADDSGFVVAYRMFGDKAGDTSAPARVAVKKNEAAAPAATAKAPAAAPAQ